MQQRDVVFRGEDDGMKKSVLTSGGLLLAFGCFLLWGIAAMNYEDSVAVGRYIFKHGDETSTLVLHPDHTFQQAVRLGSMEQHSEGKWRRPGEGGISFSSEFLMVSGCEREPDGTVFGDMHK